MPLTKGSQLIGTAGKLAGLKMGQQKLFAQLRKDGVLIKSIGRNGVPGLNHNVPKQPYIDAGLFEVFGRYITKNYIDGDIQEYKKTTAVTPKGIAWLRKKYGKPADPKREVIFSTPKQLQLNI